MIKIRKKKKKHLNHSINDKKELKPKKVRRKWWKKILSFLIFCCAMGVFAVFGFLVYIVSTSGEFDPNKLANQDQTIIYDNENRVIAKLGIEKRESVKYDKLPQVLVDAIVATEDSRFFQHNGVDGARFLKAAVGQVMGKSYSGGGSTLTMQVVKNNLTSTKKSIIRKFQDIYIAVFFMERKYTKQEIIEFYVNDSFLGGTSVYGVEEASKYYFGKSVSDLSLPEAAIIAGMFQAPYSYDPYRFPDKTKARMETVLKLMVRHGYITKEEAEMAKKIDIPSLLVGKNESDNPYQGFIDTVVEEIKNKTDNDPALVSMEVHTTMNPGMQDGINKILAGDGYNWVNDKVQAGITIIDVKSGAISAIGTGRNRVGERSLNYATQTYRQPGSTAKPIFAYGPGFEYDNFSTYQLFTDEPWTYSNGGNPGNWDGGYKGLMTLKDAVAISRNIPAIKAIQTVNADVGNKKVVEFVENLGIKLKDGVAYESYSIGGLETGVTTTQMAAAYAAFASGGYYTEPYTVKSITYRSTGETTEFEVKRKQAMKESTAYLMNNVLEYAARSGFSGGTSAYRGTVAAKTGTSNYDEATMQRYGLPGYAVNDLWTVAYTPQHSIALWYGYDKIDSQYFNGSGTPKDQLMAAIMRYIPVTDEVFNKPSSVVASQVEVGSWPPALPSKYTPADLIRTEYFAAGTEPAEESPRFQQLNDVTNLKATESSSGVKLSWDYKAPDVTTEEYLKEYFSQSVFGHSTDQFVGERLAYNNDALGGLGFGIYMKTSKEDTKRIAFTKDKSYTYAANFNDNNVTFIVKAEYGNFGSTASNGVSVKTKVTAVIPTDGKALSLSLKGQSEVSLELANSDKYKENGIIVTYNKKNVTEDSSTTVVSFTFDGDSCSSASEGISQCMTRIEQHINAITESKTITILYNVKYTPEGGGNTITKEISRKVVIK